LGSGFALRVLRHADAGDGVSKRKPKPEPRHDVWIGATTGHAGCVCGWFAGAHSKSVTLKLVKAHLAAIKRHVEGR
jgi:hypothetical protein